MDEVIEAVRAAARGESALQPTATKLGLTDRTQAAIFALQRGLVPLDQALTRPPGPGPRPR